MARSGFMRMMKHRCAVQRFTASDIDTYGQPTGSWGSVAVNQVCLLQQRRGLATTGRREGSLSVPIIFQDTMFCPFGANIREGDRVTSIVFAGTTTYVRKDTSGNAVTFTVKEVVDAAGQGHHLEVKLTVVET